MVQPTLAGRATRALPPRYRAMALTGAAPNALRAIELPMRPLLPGEIRLRVQACGVCRTDLHIVDGELGAPALPRVPGHEIVGEVVEHGAGCGQHPIGTRVGVPWLGATCHHCQHCARGRENLCENALFTGWTVDGGYAEYAIARDAYSFALPEDYSDEEAAPLLCAGLIGFRALRMLPQATAVGLYGFGAAAHLVAQVALTQGRQVYAFTRPGDEAAQALARSLGVQWAGDSTQSPPGPMDGAILFAPAGELVPRALQAVEAAGTVVCAGIHMSDIPSFPYRWLWGERCVRSVANLTRRDATEFLAFAGAHRLRLATTRYDLADAAHALDDLRAGRIAGAAVLRVDA
ncbi:zinc-dependent alcohol dehydrogenase family protein [Piscinibacter sp. XHJ-5]|uniref:zinc-dependent alcohol dehydrogenase family protein n=1 Tax=Piscinibacter sp. XHJ-5 TaxID=3037797 RepID=UPI002452903A|nr:zinc-dependent alcohol dehydrogenase family protein [Piscinibacter sp. XHJ-5]